LVYSARGAVAGLVQCGTHLFPPFEFVLEAIDPARLGVGPRRDAEDALERTGQPAVAGLRGAGVDRPARLAHQGNGGIGAVDLRGMAAPAGAVSLAFGGLGDRVERDLRAAGPAAGAGRTAIDAGRAHGVHE